MSKLLVVDDEQSICWGLSQLGESIGHEVMTASSAEQALQLVEEVEPDAIILDVRLPGMDGIAAMEHLRDRVGQVPVIVITAYGDLDTAVQAVRNGAFEYIVKPFSLDKVQVALARALAAKQEASPAHICKGSGEGLIGQSLPMQEVFNQIALAASSDTSVLIYGESGTGKEMAARAIHQYSERAEGPFVAVNAASLSPSLAESELFGHASGAFTGADSDRTGLLVQASGGTLFLDEVADIPLPTQVKLLRALEQGEVLPVGSVKPVKTDFRIISATHQDLLHRIGKGKFRHDFYYRLGAFRINMPPLRDRLDDIPALSEHFLAASTKGESKPQRALSDEAIAELKRRPWNGNVRELRNAIEHSVILARGGMIEPYHLPDSVEHPSLSGEAAEANLEESLAALIRQWTLEKVGAASKPQDLHDQLLALVEPPLLEATLKKHQNKCAAAARQLGMHRTTLRKKLDDYTISGD